MVGAFEATPLAHVRKVFETSTFGVKVMTHAVIPQLRERRAVHDTSGQLRFPAGTDAVVLARAG